MLTKFSRTGLGRAGLTLVVFLVVWGLLSASEALFDTRRTLDELVKSLVPSVRVLSAAAKHRLDTVLVVAWQPLVALAIAFGTVAKTKKPAELVVRRFFPAAAEFFGIPRVSADPLDFRSERTPPLVGRTTELARLMAFASGNERFQWHWLTGGAGTGKSRLALEWLRVLRDWDVGFVRGGANVDDVAMWQPRRSTALVIDDAGERTEAVLGIIESLGARSDTLAYPVRALLLDRSVPSQLEKLGQESRFTEHRYEREPVSLKGMGRDDVTSVAQAVVGEVNRELTPGILDEIVRTSEGHPFFVILAAEIYRENGRFRWDGREELLRFQIDRMLGKFSALGLDAKSLPLLCLATLTHGIPWDAAKGASRALEAPLPRKSLLDQITNRDTREAIPGIEPDLLGEYLVLQCLGTMTASDAAVMVNEAWTISPARMAASLYRVADDFPLHKRVPDLAIRPAHLANVDRYPERAEQAAVWIFAQGLALGALMFHGRVSASTELDQVVECLWNRLLALDLEASSRSVFGGIIAAAQFPMTYYALRGNWSAMQSVLDTLVERLSRFEGDAELTRGVADYINAAVANYLHGGMRLEALAVCRHIAAFSERAPDDRQLQALLARPMVALREQIVTDWRSADPRAALRCAGRIIHAADGEPVLFYVLTKAMASAFAAAMREDVLDKEAEEVRWDRVDDLMQAIIAPCGMLPHHAPLQMLNVRASTMEAIMAMAAADWARSASALERVARTVARFPADYSMQQVFAGLVATCLREQSVPRESLPLDTLRSTLATAIDRFPDELWMRDISAALESTTGDKETLTAALQHADGEPSPDSDGAAGLCNLMEIESRLQACRRAFPRRMTMTFAVVDGDDYGSWVIDTAATAIIVKESRQDADATCLTNAKTVADLIVGRFDPTEPDQGHLFLYSGDPAVLYAIASTISSVDAPFALRFDALREVKLIPEDRLSAVSDALKSIAAERGVATSQGRS
jgi:hypothetical protein